MLNLPIIQHLPFKKDKTVKKKMCQISMLSKYTVTICLRNPNAEVEINRKVGYTVIKENVHFYNFFLYKNRITEPFKLIALFQHKIIFILSFQDLLSKKVIMLKV